MTHQDLKKSISEFNTQQYYSKKEEKIREKLEILRSEYRLIEPDQCWGSKKIEELDKALFFIINETLESKTVFLGGIDKYLRSTKGDKRNSKKKVRINQTSGLIIDAVKKKFIIKRQQCPNPECNSKFSRVPHYCGTCGHKLILQEITYRNGNYKPQMIIEITEQGLDYFLLKIRNITSSYKFFKRWLENLEL